MSQRVTSVMQRRAMGPLHAFRQAVAAHNQGRMREAEQLYQTVLEADARHFDALYRLGLLRLQQSKFDDAAGLFRRAVKIEKKSADAQFHLGVALAANGCHEDAILRYQKALSLRPHFPEAHNNLGYALQLLGRAAEAVRHYEKALEINPDYAEARNNMGSALGALGDHEAALVHYQGAIANRPNYAEAHQNLGNALLAIGREDEAIVHYRTVLALRPGDPEAHHRLGKTLQQLDRFEEASIYHQQALAIRPDYADAHNALGNALHMVGRTEEAIKHFREALVVRPNDGEAYNNLGGALRALGRQEEAERAFVQAITRASNKIGVYWNLASSTRFTLGDPHLLAMQELARDMTSLAVEDQIKLHFALSKAFADVGDQQSHVRHLLQGNKLKRQQITYDEGRVLERFERIRSVFGPELVRDRQGLGHPSSVPVFIVGMPRSGTTLVEQILASHPSVFGAGELRQLGRLVEGVKGPNGTEFPEAVPTMSGDQLRRLGDDYLAMLSSRTAPGAKRITDKMPGNFAYAGLIHLVFPNARIIYTRRDLRDTALSCFSILFARGNLEFTYDLAELGRYCRGYRQLMEHWQNVLPDDVLLGVEYEELVGDLERQARRIVAHCGLEWNDACLAFYDTERSVRTASANQVRRPIYRSSVGRWRAYADLLQPFVQAL